MNTRQIEIFMSLADTLNFAKTAESLYTTQPTISRQIQALEEELKIELFRRNSRKVELTTAGSYLSAEFKRLMKDLSTIVRNAQKLEYELASELRIGVCDLTELPCLPKAMRIFREAYPRVLIDLKVDGFGNIVREVEKGELDLAFCMKSPTSGVNEMEYRTLRKGSFYCLVPVDNSLKEFDRLTPEDICGYPWIFRNRENSTPAIREIQMRLRERWPENPVLYSASPAQSALMVKAGFGISIVVGYSVEASPDYRMIPFQMPGIDRQDELDLIVCWKRGSSEVLKQDFADLSRLVQEELDGLREPIPLWPEA